MVSGSQGFSMVGWVASGWWPEVGPGWLGCDCARRRRVFVFRSAALAVQRRCSLVFFEDGARMSTGPAGRCVLCCRCAVVIDLRRARLASSAGRYLPHISRDGPHQG